MEATDFFVGGGYYGSGVNQTVPEKRVSEQKPMEHFAIDDLLDFPNEDTVMADGFFDNIANNSTDSSTVTAVDSCNSSGSGSENQFPCSMAQFNGDLCVPLQYEELEELEWLSNFVEESFSNENNLQSLHLLNGSKPHTPEYSSPESQLTTATTTTTITPIFTPETPLPGKARSKRSRAAPCDWSTRLLLGSETVQKPSNSDSSGRKCLHCASERTPQWRTGPMGPKTLCNACGVRYKSGRLVPEYRPASSPTFISARHSNSHRKVLELRRQKEMHTSHHPQFITQNSIFGLSNGGDLIQHHHGHDFRHLI